MKRLADISLKNKIFLSIMAVILVISLFIAFVTRWMLISTFSTELELRGTALARSIAGSVSGYILDKDYPKLLSFIFDEAQLKERKHLVAYIFVVDPADKVLSHTFTRPFPDALERSNPILPGKNKSIRLITLDDQTVYDIAIAINEGIYRIGTVHVGLNKNHIDSLIKKLRITFAGFLSLILVLIFFVSHRLAKYITMPMSRLVRIINELGQGNFDMDLDSIHLKNSDKSLNLTGKEKPEHPMPAFDELSSLGEAPVLKRRGDEVIQLADSFNYLFWKIKPFPTQLREMEEKYRSLFDSGPEPIFVVDRGSYEILDANPKAMNLYGYSREELIGMSFLRLGAGDNLTKECMAYFSDENKSMECVFYPKMLHYKKEGQPVYVNVHACPIAYKGQPSIIVEVMDVTNIVEKDAQLIQAGKMKSLGEMSAGIAHELNQPLNTIKLGSEFLSMMIEENRSLPKEQIAQVVKEISTQVDRAAGIIDTLRSFGRKSGLIKEKVDINKPIRGVFTTVGGQFELENIKINLELSEGISSILAHENQLLQVFLNLATNARDAILEKNKAQGTTAGGVITIRSYQEDQRVLVEVQDNGTGIPEDVREKIFHPFFTTKEAGAGMGLGLAIAYGIVKDFGGDIQIKSKEGAGTTFKLIFPVAS
ncbi:MAG: PAS domain S-box protein [Desulfobacterales bacterium]|nr:PAS domain S-box protein [Desulfobacterales bacterium]